MFGQLTAQPLDKEFRLPARRRVIWEYGQDLALYLSYSVILNVVLAIAAAIMAVVLVVIFQRPPVVLAEEQGYVYWRSTEQFKLRSSILKTYLDTVTGALLTIEPGSYDLTGLLDLVDPRVLKVFSEAFDNEPERRERSGHRQLWRVLEVKRYFDAKLPQYLTLAVRGEKTVIEEKKTELGASDLRTSSSLVVYLVYLNQILPSPANPWGLKLVGLAEKEDSAESERIWEASFDLSQAVDQRGQPILPPRNSTLTPPP